MIQQRNHRMRQMQKAKRRRQYKKMLTQANAAIVLFSTCSVLDQVKTYSGIVHAQESTSRTTPVQFIRNIANSAKQIAGRNNLYASVMIAQAGLESGWGNSTLAKAPNYNLFGIKGSFNGQSAEMNTLEDDGTGEYYQIKDKFRRYNSYHDSLLDYAKVLTGENSTWLKNYYSGALKSNTTSYKDATQHLTGRYATDTRYGSKLNSIIETYNLTQYDTPGSLPTRPAQSSAPTVSAQSKTRSALTSNSGSTYTVQPGDGFYRIAQANGVSVNDLLAANGLSLNSMIHPNQQLVIPNGGGSTAASASQSANSVNTRVEKSTTVPNVRPSVASKPTNASSATYTVQPGDGFYRIAQVNGVSVTALLAANGLTMNSLIHPNQSLIIPGSTSQSNSNKTISNRSVSQAAPATSSSSMSTSASSNKESLPSVPSHTTQGNYTIQAGDSLYRIAINNGMTLNQLLQANGISVNTPIFPGQKLYVQARPMASSIAQSTTVSANATTSTSNQTINHLVQEQASQAPTNQTSAGITHVVQSGDSLYAIAKQYGLDVNDLIAKNKGMMIHPGQVLNF